MDALCRDLGSRLNRLWVKWRDAPCDSPQANVSIKMKKLTKTNKIKPRDIVLDRRKDVAEKHYIERRSIRNIAKELDCHPDTVWKDLQYLKKHFEEQFIVIDKNQILSSILYNRNFNLRRLSNIRKDQQRKGNVPTELKVIDMIDNLHTKTVEDMTNLGFIEKPKERSEIEHKTYKFIIEDAKGEFSTGNKVEAKSKAKTSVKNTNR